MRLPALLLLCLLGLLARLGPASAADGSCMDRCENGFDSRKTCQCDSMCKYYRSCCSDFEATCGMTTRGDTFVFAEDDEVDAPTPSPGPPARDRPFTADGRPPKATRRPPSDFGRSRYQQRSEATLQMTAPPPPVPADVATPGTSASPPRATPPGQDDLAVVTTKAPVTTPTPAATTAAAPTDPPDPDAEACSGRAFDSFMQVKNGSIYAFRGDYFFELDQRKVAPGYPKLIKDVWGIRGPIDAAFTRVNCQGKTYIFKGNQYWRFEDGVLDEDYPREINVGFDKIPDHVDAAFALPAPSHHGKEKVYFFKGDEYFIYEFLHQPSHEECISMSERSPSTLFRRYTDVYASNYERFLSNLFSDLHHHKGHHFINKDWKGLKSPVDGAMAGRLYVPPAFLPDQQWGQQQGQQWGQQQGQQWGGQQWGGQQWGGQQWGRRRQSRSPFWGSIADSGMNMGQAFAERGMEMGLRMAERRMEMEERLGRDWDRDQDRDRDRDWARDWDRDWDRRWDQDWDQNRRRDRYRNNNRGNYDSRYYRRDDWDFLPRSLPVQSVYFFKGDKYYRMDLSTKRLDPGTPPYPRSVAKYWLGCKGTAGAEKKK